MRIERRYCGPPDSAHGGVAVGRFVGLVDPGPVEVRLLGPPPLDTDLDSRTESDGTVVVSGPGGDLARVRLLDQPVSVEPFRMATDAELDAAQARYLGRVADEGHVFPTCFGCGPDRHDGDALRQFTGRIDGTETVAARFRVADDGAVPDWLTVAGLDCPSGWAVSCLVDEPPAAVVLGAMQCQLDARAHGGVDYQVRGRVVSVEGRKYTSEVAMLAPDGTTVASARAVWIGVDPARFAASATKDVPAGPSG